MTIPSTPYDQELGKITDLDREYAVDLLDDLEMADPLPNEIQTVAEWFRKVRYEAVMADRAKRGPNAELTEEKT